MARKLKIRPELENSRTLLLHGEEVARFNIDGTYVVNPLEVWKAMRRYVAGFQNSWVPITQLNQSFGLRGTWGRDIAVLDAIDLLAEHNLVQIKHNDDGSVWRVCPVGNLARAKRELKNTYLPALESFAGLEPINEQEDG